MPSPQLQNIGLALQGLGSGLSGQLPQFLQAQNQRAGLEQQAQQIQMQQVEQQQKMAIERQKTMFTDAFAASQLLDTGNLDGVVQLGINRLQMLKQLSQQDPTIDPSDTQRVTQLAIAARNGDEEALELLKGELSNTVQVGQAIGVLQAPAAPEIVPASNIVNGQVVTRDSAGNFLANTVPNLAEEKAGFKMLSPEEAAGMGLDPARPYQMNIGTGQVSAIGSGPVSVTEVNLPAAVDEGTKEYGKGMGMRATARVEQANNALSQNSALQRMNEAITAGAQTGLGQETILDVKNLANSLFGIPVDQAAGEQEVLRALSNRLVMEVRNPAGGLGLTGSTSNRDLDFLTAAVPNLAKTPIGNALLMEYLMKQNQFKVDVANEQQRIIDDNGGNLPSNLDSQLMRFVNSYEFMDDAFKADVEAAVQAAEAPQNSRFTVEVIP
jgi:hypothetical protein